MKKTLIACLLLSVLTQHSQTAFEKNGNHLTFGYGFPNLYKSILTTVVKNNQAMLNSYSNNGTSPFSYSTYGVGPLFFKYEYGIIEHIGLGLVLGYFSTGIDQTYTYQSNNYQGNTYMTQTYTDVSSLKINSTSVGARFNYHFGSMAKLDPYVGFASGYTYSQRTITYKTDNPNGQRSSITSNNPIPIYLGLTFGLRGYFTDNIGFYAECGLDKWAVIQGGLAIKLK